MFQNHGMEAAPPILKQPFLPAWRRHDRKPKPSKQTPQTGKPVTPPAIQRNLDATQLLDPLQTLKQRRHRDGERLEKREEARAVGREKATTIVQRIYLIAPPSKETTG